MFCQTKILAEVNPSERNKLGEVPGISDEGADCVVEEHDGESHQPVFQRQQLDILNPLRGQTSQKLNDSRKERAGHSAATGRVNWATVKEKQS